MGIGSRDLAPPTRLADDHDVGDFSCGDEAVDSWLKTRARKAEVSGTARTFVVGDGPTVIAYYSLSNAVFRREEHATAKARSGMPSEVPAILLGQLGVDYRHQQRGLGRFLLRDAMGRVLHASEFSGIVVMHLHASTEAAHDYYQRLGLGFLESRTEPRTFYLPVATIRRALLPEPDAS